MSYFMISAPVPVQYASYLLFVSVYLFLVISYYTVFVYLYEETEKKKKTI